LTEEIIYNKRRAKLTEFIFFGNYFYGICAVALSIEASLQQNYPLNHPLFYAAVFLSTILYYTIAYVHEGETHITNKRGQWYIKNSRLVRYSQLIVIGMFLACSISMFIHLKDRLAIIPTSPWALVLVFPVSGILYYGSFGRYNLRRIGWLKPFIIGFTWAGLVTIYPIIFYCIGHNLKIEPTLIGALLFLKNFMFISLLCILFDIKDYATDYNQQLKTFVVHAGLRNTIFKIIIPLCIVGLGTFLAYGFTHGFSAMKIILNTIPFLSLVAVAYSLHRRRSILYYLIIIDGLMLLKALCGITAMTFF
jgi:hypothetical protein